MADGALRRPRPRFGKRRRTLHLQARKCAARVVCIAPPARPSGWPWTETGNLPGRPRSEPGKTGFGSDWRVTRRTLARAARLRVDRRAGDYPERIRGHDVEHRR